MDVVDVLIGMHMVIYSLLFWSFGQAQFGDPGIVPKNLNVPACIRKPILCHICCSWKPPRAHHARHLNRCVFRMDHVCKFINNVVGYSNQKFFILLLGYALLASVSNSLVALFAMLRLMRETKIITFGAIFSSPLESLSLVINVLAFIVLKDYLKEQIECIESNVTLIETFQESSGDGNEDVFRQIFGDNPWLWLIPVNTTAPPNYTEESFSQRKLSLADANQLGVEPLTDSKLESKE